jgi:hypothetical protein
MIDLITFEEVDRYSDKYPFKAIVFHAATGCGAKLSNIAVMLEPLSENPCFHMREPLGINAINKMFDIYKNWHNKNRKAV